MLRAQRAGLLFLATFLALSIGASPVGAVDEIFENPPGPGFDAAGSDLSAIALADEVMQAMGGRQAWENTRFLTWTFFGRRTHLWDKAGGRCRIDLEDEEGRAIVLCFSLHAPEGTPRGRVWVDGQELTDRQAKTDWLVRGESMWINDAYWVFMPYKLKDGGVTLKMVGPGKMEDGRDAAVLELTFRGVGRTPENKYHVFVADDTKLVEQWSFFKTHDQAEPDFTTPWANWQSRGDIMLSGDRGDGQISGIAVLDEVSDSRFEGP